MLDAALAVMNDLDGGSITLDGVARAAGMTKPGLMYHFPTREALLLAIVDHAADRLEQALIEVLDGPADTASPAERIRAYVKVVADGTASRAEYAIFTEAAYRPELTGPWTQRMSVWLKLPPDLDPAQRVTLQTARLAADGLWAAQATGVFPPDSTECAAIVAFLDSLTTPPARTDHT